MFALDSQHGQFQSKLIVMKPYVDILVGWCLMLESQNAISSKTLFDFTYDKVLIYSLEVVVRGVQKKCGYVTLG